MLNYSSLVLVNKSRIFFSFFFHGKFMQKNIKAKLSCHKVIKQSFMLFGHCSEITRARKLKYSSWHSFYYQGKWTEIRVLVLSWSKHRAVHEENCFCKIAWLWHFHWKRTERRTLMACIYWVLNRHLIDWLIGWWKFYTMTASLKHTVVSWIW